MSPPNNTHGTSLSPIFDGAEILRFVEKYSNALPNTEPDKILASLVLP